MNVWKRQIIVMIMLLAPIQKEVLLVNVNQALAGTVFNVKVSVCVIQDTQEMEQFVQVSCCMLCVVSTQATYNYHFCYNPMGVNSHRT